MGKWFRVFQTIVYLASISFGVFFTIFRYYEPAAVALLWAVITKMDMNREQ